MSCGQPHETDCSEVLERMYSYLDGELDAGDISRIHAHLDECAPCLRQYGLERSFRDLVARSCKCSAAPDHLRAQIRSRIGQFLGNPARTAE